MRRSLIFDTTLRLVFDAAVVFSVYLLFAGHNQPGGGFVGGLVAAAALALRFVAGGAEDVQGLLPWSRWGVLSVGLTLVTGSAIVPLAFGHPLLDQASYDWTVPLIGDMHAATATVFDAGIYLVVVGLLLMVVAGLGDEHPVDPDPIDHGSDGSEP